MIPVSPTSWKKRVFTDFRRHRHRVSVATTARCFLRRAICRAFPDPPRARTGVDPAVDIEVERPHCRSARNAQKVVSRGDPITRRC